MNAMTPIQPSVPLIDMAADPHEARRYAGALAIVLAIHALPVLVAAWWLGSTITAPVPEPAVLIDMAPPTAQPMPPSEQPPGPRQVKAEAPQPKVERDPVKTPPAVNPAVSLPQVAPAPPKLEANKPAEQTTAPPARPLPPAPPAGGTPTWQGLVLGALNKVKRYPVAAQVRRQQGVPWIRFVIDRDGKVLSSRLERSSGYQSLDQEAANLPKRAQPLPKPPADITTTTVELVLPVEFFLK